MGQLVFTKMEAGKFQTRRGSSSGELRVFAVMRLSENGQRRQVAQGEYKWVGQWKASFSVGLTIEFISAKCQEMCFVMTRATKADTTVGDGVIQVCTPKAAGKNELQQQDDSSKGTGTNK